MINLLPTIEADYQAYLLKIIPEYAADKVRAGNWTEAEFMERSRKEYERYLLQGIHTPEHLLHVFGDNIAARGLYKKVGYIETNVSMAREI